MGTASGSLMRPSWGQASNGQWMREVLEVRWAERPWGRAGGRAQYPPGSGVPPAQQLE